MSETPNFNSGFNPEIPFNGVETKKDTKEKSKKTSLNDGRKLAASVLNSNRNEKPQESAPNREDLKRPPKLFLEKVIANDKENTAVNIAQEKAEEILVGSEEAYSEGSSAEEVISEQVERSVAEDLYNGEEISLREISQIPPERDEVVIDEALELATAIETSEAYSLPEDAEKTEEISTAAEGVESEPMESNAKEPETAPPIVTRSVPIPIPRTRSYNVRRARAVPFGMPPNYPGGGAAGGNTPPPNGENNTNYDPGYNPNTTQSAAGIKKTIENAEWDSFQGGRRKGLVAGLLVGGGIEHFRHKRREKKMEKRQDKETLAQQKRIERLEHDYEQAKQSQESEQPRAKANMTQERFSTIPKRENHAKEIEELKKTKESMARHTHEVIPSEEELLANVPKDHHLERSAWHNIEVDKHGRAVQESAIEYGHEYYKERVHEVAPKQQIDSAAGEVALVAAALSDRQNQSSESLPVGQSLSVLDMPQQKQQRSVRAGARTALKAVTTPPSSPFSTLLWLCVLIVIAIVIVTIMR